MKTQVGLLFALALLTCSSGHAQSTCPEGFRQAGTLSGSGSYGTPFDKKAFIFLPRNATLDTSYQQTDVQATNGHSGASSKLRPQDIPRGIFIIPYGKSDEVFQQEWAVSDPELKTIKDATGQIIRYKFGMRLVCKVGKAVANPLQAECSVGVDVCYKPIR